MSVGYQPEYRLTCALVLKIFKRLVLIYNCGSVKYEKVKEFPSKLSASCCLFHENCQFFKGFEVTKTDNSLILKFILRTRTGGSWFVEYLKTRMDDSLKI
jgi:hypothetical protein